MQELGVSSFGPIRTGTVQFGDLTVVVGPQASGKSLLVQLFKAIADADSIGRSLKADGFDWLNSKNPLESYVSLYFGEGMGTIWHKDTKILVDGEPFDFGTRVVNRSNNIKHLDSVFFIPAQRVLVLQDGWPSPALSRSMEVPYCTRHFSNILRKLLDSGPTAFGWSIFPSPGRLKVELHRLLDEGIYAGGNLKLENKGMRKRLVLEPEGSGSSLPYGVWSAGQREFTPLLLGFDWMMPTGKTAKIGHIETVIIEEPEMGLHPQAIISFCLMVLELLHRGYKVIVSTHSPVVLDVVWALRELRSIPKPRAIRALAEIFRLKSLNPQMWDLLRSALKKTCRTFYFERQKDRSVHIVDISTLDPGAKEESVSGWGGLSAFSGHIADVVGKALSEGGDR
ncbi:MAG: AAA family ATPase [Planctomycetota bacterium]